MMCGVSSSSQSPTTPATASVAFYPVTAMQNAPGSLPRKIALSHFCAARRKTLARKAQSFPTGLRRFDQVAPLVVRGTYARRQ